MNLETSPSGDFTDFTAIIKAISCNKLKRKQTIHFSKFPVAKVTNGRICFPSHVNEKVILASTFKIRPVTSHWASELKVNLEPCM